MGKWIHQFMVSPKEAGTTLLYNVIVILIVFVIAKLLIKIFKWIFRRMQDHNRLDRDLIPVLRASTTYGIYILALMVALEILGMSTASILTILGAAGLAIGLALKDSLGNIASGVAILFVRPFRTNDVVTINGQTGVVKSIGLFVTQLTTAEGLLAVLPNSNVLKDSVINFTRNGTRRMDLSIGIGYQDSIDVATEILLGIAKSDRRILPQPAPEVIITQITDHSVNLVLRIWTHVNDFGNTQFDVTKAMKEKIMAAGIEIPFPQRTLHIIHEKTDSIKE